MSQRRAALVTGSSRGIGKAVALALAGTHDIVLNYRARQDEAEAAAELFRAAGASVLSLQADISDPDSLIRLADAGLERFGRIDTLVTNAATGLHWPISISGWQQIQDSVQVIAGSFATLVSRLSPAMVAGGRIVVSPEVEVAAAGASSAVAPAEVVATAAPAAVPAAASAV